MRPAPIAAALVLTLMLVLSQCVVIGGMAWTSAQTSGELDRTQALLETAKAQIPNEFYRGMYALCWDAYQGSGYPDSDVMAACNDHVAEQRDLKVHLQDAPGYEH